VYDLYTGIGSIALYLADACGQVVGIEEVGERLRAMMPWIKANRLVDQSKN